MLTGIHPLLTGELLLHLDAMGHADAVVIADAHFPAAALGDRVVTLPGSSATDVLAAVRTVIPLNEAPALDVMLVPEGTLPVQRELAEAAGLALESARILDRAEFYATAGRAYLIIRTGELRPYGNAILRKGLVGA